MLISQRPRDAPGDPDQAEVAAILELAEWDDESFPVGASPGSPVTHPQRPEGYAALQRHLAATRILPATILVVLEATGSY